MATIRQIEKAFNTIVGDTKGTFFVESEEVYGFTDVGDMNAVEAELAKIVNNDPILEQLSELDKFVSRAQEDLIIAANTDSFLVGKANQKKVLRSQLL